MLGKLATAAIGRKVAQRFEGPNAGMAGAVIGVAVPAVIAGITRRRIGALGWLAIGVGGYAAKRWFDKQQATPTTPVIAPATAENFA